MADTYTTKQGDTFESIAWFHLGNSNKMTELIRENRAYMDTAVFEAGVVLMLPEESDISTAEKSTTSPPWR